MKRRSFQLAGNADPLLDDKPTTVRLVETGDGRPIDVETGEPPVYEPPPLSRTPMQKTQDDIFDKAELATTTAQEAAAEALAWLDLLVELPKELRDNLPALLTHLSTLISEQRRLRG